MLKYKCERSGINIIINEESYTSKASFLDLDFIPIYKKNDSTKHVFSGYRESRGMYKIKGSDKRINADVNGSYNVSAMRSAGLRGTHYQTTTSLRAR